jgi:HK97 family phage portal protein
MSIVAKALALVGVKKSFPSGGSLFYPREDHMPNWWQRGFDKPSARDAMTNAAVYAAVSTISQEIAKYDLRHWRQKEDGGRELMRGAVASVLRNPNEYQTRSDFWLFMMANLLLTGNAYAIAQRDNRGAVSAFHPRPASSVAPYVAPDGSIFYQVGGDVYNDLTPDLDHMVPARDVLHLRLFCLNHWLIGVSPLTACAASIAGADAIQKNTANFFANMSRPGGILRTPKPLNADAAARLKSMWEQGTSNNFMGRTAVLDNDVQWQPLTISAQDAALVDQYRMSIADVARVYRVPLWMLGEMDKASFRNVETLQRSFVVSTLGFYIEAIEDALDKFFRLPVDQYVEFDVEGGLMRAETKDRFEAYSSAIQNGILTPNEARKLEDLEPIDGGDEGYLQAQMVPIGVSVEKAKVELDQLMNPPAPPPAPVAPPAAPADEPKPAPAPEPKSFSAEEIRAAVRSKMRAA